MKMKGSELVWSLFLLCALAGGMLGVLLVLAPVGGVE
jgi:hypothetical protein